MDMKQVEEITRRTKETIQKIDDNEQELWVSKFTMLSNFGPDGKEAQILTAGMHLVDMINDVVVYYVEQIRELKSKETYQDGYDAGYEDGYDVSLWG